MKIMATIMGDSHTDILLDVPNDAGDARFKFKGISLTDLRNLFINMDPQQSIEIEYVRYTVHDWEKDNKAADVKGATPEVTRGNS